MRLTFVLLMLSFFPTSLRASEGRIEAGVFQTLSNRFNIPNPGGARILVKNSDLNVYGRLSGEIQLSANGFFRFTIAPFNAKFSYLPDGAIVYNGVTFPARSAVDVSYKFNSYRAGYAHRFRLSDSLLLQLGLIGKIRQAKIALIGAGTNSTYSNVGFVPLFNLGIRAKISGPWELRMDVDGAAAKQGRAIDGALEAFYQLDESGSGLSAGARVLEGGADNTKVNTFALVRYAFLAVTKGF